MADTLEADRQRTQKTTVPVHSMPKKESFRSITNYQCDQCGLVLERDINAARTIRLRGLRLFSRAAGPACRSEAADAANVVPMVASSEVVKHGYDTELFRQ